MDEYKSEREKLLKIHYENSFGSDEILTENEEKFNKMLMGLKKCEIFRGFKNPSDFNPMHNFLEVHEKINQSKLFQIIKRMPKGAVLHSHDAALLSAEGMVSLTYWPNLWQSGEISDETMFKFSTEKPGTDWLLVADERLKMGQKNYDKIIRKLFTLLVDNPTETYRDVNVAWTRLEKLFSRVFGIITYKPVWREYFDKSLKEFYDDGVQLLEFRGILPELYDLDGNKYGPLEVAQIYYETLQRFRADYQNSIDARFIYAPHRFADDKTFDEHLQLLLELVAKYPDFVVGFDLVGQEDLGRPLKDFAEKLLQLPKNIKFYFHAGETKWSSMESDENLIDAILLGTKRIGHGFALPKYPILLDLIKEKDICIEVNPISNQVLKLVDDFRNHPAVTLFANNCPLIIAPDGRAFWEACPLSHDFYIAFVGITSANHDLRVIKKLIKNSIKYSSLTENSKSELLNSWLTKWNEFIENSLI